MFLRGAPQSGLILLTQVARVILLRVLQLQIFGTDLSVPIITQDLAFEGYWTEMISALGSESKELRRRVQD